MRQDFLHPPSGTKCVQALSDTIFASSVHCSAAVGYSFWVIQAPPTAAQAASICQNSICMQLVRNMQGVAPTECVMYDGFYLYKDILNPVLQVCPTGSASTQEGSGGHTTTIVVVMIVLCLLAFGAGVWWRRRRQRETTDAYPTRPEALAADHDAEYGPPPSATEYYEASPQPQRGTAKVHGVVWTAMPTAVAVPATAPFNAPLYTESIPLFRDPQIQGARVSLDDVHIGEFIASGAYGSVFKGLHLGKPVAIKMLRAGPASDVKMISKFLEEIKLMASLSHSRIVTFVGAAWTTPVDLCALIEYMDGGDLLSLLRRFDEDADTPMGFDPLKLQIALDVADGLAYLHARSPAVIHRDLKSNNILLTKQYSAKLTDFGVSREEADAKMTMNIGTQRWMAPEVIRGEDYDARADVFSFGVVLSELDTNKIPFATHELGGMTPLAMMQSIARGQLTVEFSYASDPRIVALGRECVSLDPARRPTMESVRRRIAAMLD